MDFDDMSSAVEQAEGTLKTLRVFVKRMARMCAGRLRDGNVDHIDLCKLKRELENYNMHTGEWK